LLEASIVTGEETVCARDNSLAFLSIASAKNIKADRVCSSLISPLSICKPIILIRLFTQASTRLFTSAFNASSEIAATGIK